MERFNSRNAGGRLVSYMSYEDESEDIRGTYCREISKSKDTQQTSLSASTVANNDEFPEGNCQQWNRFGWRRLDSRWLWRKGRGLGAWAEADSHRVLVGE